MSTQNHLQTGRFYTAARKFQQLIGVTPAGETIPGGPYTVTQFIVGIAVLVAGFITRPLWSQGALTDVLFIAVAAVGATYAVGRMPGSRRSLINLINCWITLVSRPRTGTYRGKKLPASYSKTSTKRSAIRPGATRLSPASAVASGEVPAVVSASPQVPRVSGLDRLNAQLLTAPETR